MPIMKTSRGSIEPYVTKDGSTIFELMHPDRHGCRNQSLAEAVVAPGAATMTHHHHSSEEIYHVLSGQARMRLGSEEFEIGTGDTICIAPGTLHSLTNTGRAELRILCMCTPAYSHADTELLEER